MKTAYLAVMTAMEPEASLVRKRLRQRQRERLEVGLLWHGRIGDHRAVLLRCGMGEERAVTALQWIVAHYPLWGILSVGFAGGLQPDLATGDVVLADRIEAWPPQTVSVGACVTPNARLASLAATAAKRARLPRRHGSLLSHKLLVPSAGEKRLLGRQSGALAVDMESYGIGGFAATHHLPFMSLRAILDPYDMELNLPMDGLTTPDGGLRPSGALKVMMQQPMLCRSFFALWRQSRLTQRRLAVWLDHFFAMLGEISQEESQDKRTSQRL